MPLMLDQPEDELGYSYVRSPDRSENPRSEILTTK